MKRYVCYLFSLLSLAIAATSCSTDDAYIDTPTTKPDTKGLRISVSRTPFASDSKDKDTRTAHDTDFSATFKTGDRIGIIGKNNSGQVVFDNYGYEFDGTNWKPVDAAKACYVQPNMTYIAYYPYSASMNGKKSESEILNNFTVPTDQKTQKDENDLMAATIIATGEPATLTFTMKHLLCLLDLPTPTYQYQYDGVFVIAQIDMREADIAKNTITYGDIEYLISYDSKYLLVKPSNGTVSLSAETEPNGDRGSLKCRYKGSSSFTANKRYKINRVYFTIIHKNSNLFKVGDIFYSLDSNNKRGFPYPKEWTCKPKSSTRVGTVVKIGTDFDFTFKYRDENNQIKQKQCNIKGPEKYYEYGVSYTVTGYVVSDTKVKGALFDNYPNYGVPITEDPVKELHGYDYMQAGYYSKPDNPSPIWTNSLSKMPRIAGATKWFIPGVIEMSAIPFDGNDYRTCDRIDDIGYMYYRRDISDPIYGDQYLTVGIMDDSATMTVFMLAF
ncbi:fimbrillin family protein [Bacteroides timonensis]|uniref:fimbrillin family protein n=1 Tax=Bacteroides timonensis TaxID=1470345 RepID=UPI0004B92B43|nr:fimbrillin family protein [Bacteroides timonensis]